MIKVIEVQISILNILTIFEVPQSHVIIHTSLRILRWHALCLLLLSMNVWAGNCHASSILLSRSLTCVLSCIYTVLSQFCLKSKLDTIWKNLRNVKVKTWMNSRFHNPQPNLFDNSSFNFNFLKKKFGRNRLKDG